MNNIKIMGGLGNQLFQYAFGKAQAANGIEVKYNTKWYDNTRREWPRLYALDKFKVQIVDGNQERRQRTYKEREFDLSLLKMRNCDFHGYWQYLDYYKNMIPMLRKEFTVQEKYYTREFMNLGEELFESNSVSVHVRKGDYVGNKGMHDLPLSYYMEALRLVSGNIYIFTDDLNWCRENFKPEYFARKLKLVHLVDFLDFELMKLCHNNIISASTFSWWAAMLNENPNKIVIAPVGWLTGKSESDEMYYPESWIKLRA